MKSEVKKYLQKIGQKGGMSKSGPKIAAGRRNIKKALDSLKAKRTQENAKLAQITASQFNVEQKEKI